MFSTLFCRHSSAFDRATVSLECQESAGVMLVWTWTYYSAETNTLDGPENAQKYAFWDPSSTRPSYSTYPVTHILFHGAAYALHLFSVLSSALHLSKSLGARVPAPNPVRCVGCAVRKI